MSSGFKEIHFQIFSQIIFQVPVMTVTRPPSSMFVVSCLLLHHWERTWSHLPLYFTLHLPYSSPSRTSDSSEPRTGYRNVMQMFPWSVKSEEEGKHIWAEPSSTPCTSSLLKGKLFPRRGCNETSLAKWIWISTEKNTSRATRWSEKQRTRTTPAMGI